MTASMQDVRWVGDTATRKFKRVNGCLISADYRTPQRDQMHGYVLEPAS